MNTRRALWATWVLFAACLHLFGNTPGTLTVLVLSALYPPAALCLLALSARNVRAQAAFAPVRDGQVSGTLSLDGGMLRFARLECRLTCENRLTGERAQTLLTLRVRQGADAPFALHASHCGLLHITLDAFRLLDPFHLFERTLKAQLHHECLIPPRMQQVDISMGEMLCAAPESERYSTVSAGFDPGETRAIRAYVPGDALNRIHWKLTEKADRLLVRELGKPAMNSVLLLLVATAPSPRQSAAMAELFLCVSRALRTMEIEHTLGYTQAEGGEVLRASGREDDVTHSLLSAPLCTGATVSVDELSAYAHTVVVCDAPIECAGARITLLPVADEEQSAQPVRLFIA